MRVTYRRIGYAALVFTPIVLATLLLDHLSFGLPPQGAPIRYLLLPALLGYGFGPLCFYFSYKKYRRKNLLSGLTQTTIENLRPGFNAIRARLDSKPVAAPVSGEKAALVKLNINYAGGYVFLSKDRLYYNTIWLTSEDSFNLELDESSDISLADFETKIGFSHGKPFDDKDEALKEFENRENVSDSFKRGYVEKAVGDGEEVTVIGRFEAGDEGVVLKSGRNTPMIIASRPLPRLLDYYARRSRNYFLYGAAFVLAPTLVIAVALLG